MNVEAVELMSEREIRVIFDDDALPGRSWCGGVGDRVGGGRTRALDFRTDNNVIFIFFFYHHHYRCIRRAKRFTRSPTCSGIARVNNLHVFAAATRWGRSGVSLWLGSRNGCGGGCRSRGRASVRHWNRTVKSGTALK